MNTFFPSVQYLQQYQPQNQLDQMQKVAAIRSSQQQEQQSAQAFPIEQQQRQEQLTTSQLANQQTRIQMQDKQGIAQALRDSYGGPQAGSVTQQISPSLGTAAQSGAAPQSSSAAPATAQPQSSTAPPAAQAAPTNPTDRMNALISRIQDPKYGISQQGQTALMEQFTGLSQKLQDVDKATLSNIESAHKIVSQAYNSVLEAAPEDQPAQWTLERNQMLRSDSPTVKKVAAGLPAQYPGQPVPGGSPEAQSALHSIMAEQDIVAAAKSKAELPGQQAESQQKVQGASKPTPQQTNDAAQTIGTYAAIPQNMRAGLLTELQNAPDYATLQKVQQRADAANESFQRSADARQQAMALKDVGVQNLVAGKLVTEDQKLGSALDQTAGVRQLLNMSKGGNEAAAPAAMTRFAEHEIVEGGVKRMTQTELNTLTTGLGTYGRRLQSWADHGFDPKQIPETTNSELQAILDAEDKSANTAHERNVGYISNRYGASQVKGGGTNQPAMNRSQSDPLGIR